MGKKNTSKYKCFVHVSKFYSRSTDILATYLTWYHESYCQNPRSTGQDGGMLPSLALANQSPKDPDIYNLFENHIFGLAYPNRKKKKKTHKV